MATISAGQLRLDNSSIENSGGDLQVKALGISNGMLAGSIANGKLANSAITIAGASTSLGGSISADTIAGQISSGTITNSQLDGSIAFGKLAAAAVVTSAEGIHSNNNDTTIPTCAAVAGFIDGSLEGLDVKESVVVATTAVLPTTVVYANGTDGVGATITAGSTVAFAAVDGVTLSTVGDRILVKNQAAGAQNGIYKLTTVGSGSAAWVLTRTSDFNGESDDIAGGEFTFVEQGTTNADTGWVHTGDATVTVGTTAMAFSQFSGVGAITAGDGIDKTGSTLSVDYGASANMASNGLATANAAGSSALAARIDHAHIVSWTRQEYALGGAVTTDAAITSATQAPLDANGFMLFLNGVLATPGAGKDYTISGATVTWLAATGTGEDLTTTDVITYVYM